MSFDKPTFISFMGSLGRSRGGLTKSVYERILHFGRDRQTVIALTGYQADAHEVLQELKDEGRIPSDTILRHMYEELCDSPAWMARSKEPDMPYFVESGGYISKIEEHRAGSTERYFKNGVYAGLVSRHSDGRIKHFDYHDSNRPYIPEYRELVTSNGYIHVRQYLDSELKSRYQIYYDSDGVAYVSSWVSPGGAPYRISVFRDGHEAVYSKLDDLLSWWGDRLRSEYKDSVFISSEPATMAALLGTTTESDGRSLAMIHTAHHRNGMDSSDGFKSWSHYYTKNEGIDGVVMITGAQEADFIKDFPHMKGRTTSIIHAAPGVQATQSEIGDRMNKVIYLGRLAPEKQVDQAIKAFKLASSRNKNLTLDIYGIGPEEQPLKSLVKQLKLSKKVKFRGYVSDPLGAFESYGLQLMLSRQEGLGRVIQEGFSRGVPCIAYDVEYGPRELVKTGENGALVDKDDIRAVAKWINKITSKEARWGGTQMERWIQLAQIGERSGSSAGMILSMASLV